MRDTAARIKWPKEEEEEEEESESKFRANELKSYIALHSFKLAERTHSILEFLFFISKILLSTKVSLFFFWFR